MLELAPESETAACPFALILFVAAAAPFGIGSWIGFGGNLRLNVKSWGFVGKNIAVGYLVFNQATAMMRGVKITDSTVSHAAIVTRSLGRSVAFTRRREGYQCKPRY